MTTVYKKALDKHIPKHQTKTNNPVRVNLHVAVSEAKSLYGYFSNAAVCSHYYVTKDGVVEEYINPKHTSKADYQGNYSTISIETQGGLKNANTEPWTEKQIQALAELFAFLATKYNIPFKLAKSSAKTSDSHGLSYHRLGVDPWRAPGSYIYSLSRGKICPGQAKINQIPEILERAKKIAGATNTTTPPTTPSKPPTATSKPSKLKVDGVWGAATTKALQRHFGTPVDGVISSQANLAATKNITSLQRVKTPKGSALVFAIQKFLNTKGNKLVVDGLIGPTTIKALQKYFKTPIDGSVSLPSTLVKAMQTKLNAGTKWN